MPAAAEVPDVDRLAISLVGERLEVQSILDDVRRSPLARDHHVMSDMPPEVIRELLRAPIDLPSAEGLEGVVVEKKYPAGAAAIGRAEGAHVDSLRSAMHRVRPRVASFGVQVVRLDDLRDAQTIASALRAVALRVDHVDAGRAKTRHDQIATLGVRMGRVRAERRAAGIPPKVVQLIAGVRQIKSILDLPVRRRSWIDVDDGQRVGTAVGCWVDQRDKRRCFRRRLGSQLGRRIERRIRKNADAWRREGRSGSEPRETNTHRGTSPRWPGVASSGVPRNGAKHRPARIARQRSASSACQCLLSTSALEECQARRDATSLGAIRVIRIIRKPRPNPYAPSGEGDELARSEEVPHSELHLELLTQTERRRLVCPEARVVLVNEAACAGVECTGL